MKSIKRLVLAITAIAVAIPLLPSATASEIGGSQLNNSGIIVNLTEEIPAIPKAKVKSFLIVNMTTGEVLAAKNPHKKLPPASTIKALTAITLFDKLDPQRSYTARRADAQVYGTQVGIVQGRKYTIEELFMACYCPLLMMPLWRSQMPTAELQILCSR